MTEVTEVTEVTEATEVDKVDKDTVTQPSAEQARNPPPGPGPLRGAGGRSPDKQKGRGPRPAHSAGRPHPSTVGDTGIEPVTSSV